MHASVRLDGAEAATIHPESEEISFPCNSRSLLTVLESTLEQQYENIFSSIAQFRAAGLMEHAHALLIKKSGKQKLLFLFRIEKSRAIIMNEAVRVDNDDLRRAAKHIFSHFKSVTVIFWHAIQTDVARLPFPLQRFNYSEDIVVTLPATERDYLAQLGRATRKNFLRHRNRLKRDHPDLHYRVYAGEEIKEVHIRQVVEFNRARMSGKHKECGLHEQEVQRMIALSRTHGLVLIVSIGGRACAGSICHRVGANYFMEISAHDPAWNGYRMGTLCCYLTICEAIVRGGREMHLLWGRDEYKYLLLGQQRELDDVLVYRSRMHLLANCGLAARSALQAARRKVKLGLHYGARRVVRVLAGAALQVSRGARHFRLYRT